MCLLFESIVSAHAASVEPAQRCGCPASMSIDICLQVLVEYIAYKLPWFSRCSIRTRAPCKPKSVCNSQTLCFHDSSAKSAFESDEGLKDIRQHFHHRTLGTIGFR